MHQNRPDNVTLAMDRTILANERTFQAWIRTGLSALATGLGVSRFLNETMPRWMLLIIATILISFAIVAFGLAAWRYTHLHVRVAHLEVDTTPLWLVHASSTFLAIMGVLSLIGVYFAAFS